MISLLPAVPDCYTNLGCQSARLLGSNHSSWSQARAFVQPQISNLHVSGQRLNEIASARLIFFIFTFSLPTKNPLSLISTRSLIIFSLRMIVPVFSVFSSTLVVFISLYRTTLIVLK